MAFELPSQRKSDFPWWKVAGIMIAICAVVVINTCASHRRRMNDESDLDVRPGPREQYLEHQKQLEQRVERSSDPTVIDKAIGSDR